MVAQDSLEKKMDHQSPEDIERDIERTREALSVKLSRLEEEVEGKVRNTVDQVSGQILDTVDQITGKVKHSVERVQNKFDVRAHMDRDPIKTLGGALAAGFAFGAFLAFRHRPVAAHPQRATSSRRGVGSLLQGVLGAVVMTTAQRLVQGKVDSYMHSLQNK